MMVQGSAGVMERFSAASFTQSLTRPRRHLNMRPPRSTGSSLPHGVPAEPVTAAELRILKLLPTSTYLPGHRRHHHSFRVIRSCVPQATLWGRRAQRDGKATK